MRKRDESHVSLECVLFSRNSPYTFCLHHPCKRFSEQLSSNDTSNDTSGYVADVCNSRAKVVNSSAIQLFAPFLNTKYNNQFQGTLLLKQCVI